MVVDLDIPFPMKLIPRLNCQNPGPINGYVQMRLIRLYKLMGDGLVRELDNIYLAIHVLRIRIYLRPVDLYVSAVSTYQK